ncbi:MAG: hypothetical protein FJ222_06400 [Lentisphaerae bacterium]|nr:hypothetical protein [Lentisphaerota bacterium]
MTHSLAVCLRAGFRLLFLCAVLGGVAGVFLLDVHGYPTTQDFFSEQSWTETAQVTLLFLSGAAFTVGGRLTRERRIPACLLMGLAALAFVRELDWVLDKVWHGFWVVPATLVMIAVVCGVWPRRKTFFDAFAREVTQPYWGILCSGFGMVFVFSRIFGMRRNWMALLGSQLAFTSVRSVRRLAEEGTELAGYALIFVASIVFLISCYQERKHQPPPQI